MSVLQIPIEQFNPVNFVRQAPETKKTKDDKGNDITYFDIKFLNRYNVDDGRGQKADVVADLYTALPKVTTKTGIVTKTGKYEKHSILVEFNLLDESVRNMVKLPPRDANGNVVGRGGPIDDIYRCGLQVFFDNRATFGQGKINTLAAAEGAFDYPIYWPTDKTTNQIIQGKNPSKYFSLFSYGSGPSVRRTPFIPAVKTSDGKQLPPLDWEKLRNVEMDFYPVVHWKKIYVGGGKASYQSEIASAIVTRIVPASGGVDQSKTIDEVSKDENMARTLREQIESLEQLHVAVKNANITSTKQEEKSNPAPTNQLPITNFNISGVQQQATSPQPNAAPTQTYQQAPSTPGNIPGLPQMYQQSPGAPQIDTQPTLAAFMAQAPRQTQPGVPTFQISNLGQL